MIVDALGYGTLGFSSRALTAVGVLPDMLVRVFIQ